MYSAHWLSISCMSLNLACGSLFSPISCAFSILWVQSMYRNLIIGTYRFSDSLNLITPRLIRYISFQQIAPFGSTIRRFTHNVADLKKLAARDFEDILQVCLFPVPSHIC